ncbi:hypothetical protein ACIBSW_31840 [Actinoplanes sp. NPDC049668]|uniref:hypothetical protein n=1 Tax=unclassified Actinoplanes TaxID=2626549 RepID=UPI0033A74257
MKITAAQADELLAGAWFEDYASEVELYEEPVTVDEFDVAARRDELGDTEMVLFGGGLTVRGTLDLGEDIHSIYAVRGHLRARRLILGDAILVVDGKVEIGEWILGGQTQGLFDVGGRQIESDADAMLADIQAPVIVIYDRGRGVLVLRENGEPREKEHLVARALEDLDPDSRPDPLIGDRLREILLAGEPIFR